MDVDENGLPRMQRIALYVGLRRWMEKHGENSGGLYQGIAGRSIMHRTSRPRDRTDIDKEVA